MKKLFSALFAFAAIAVLCFSVSAESEKKTMLLLDGSGKTVKSYSITSSTEEVDVRREIQTAINYADSHSSEKNRFTLKIPKGEYTLARSINVNSNITLDFGNSLFKRTKNCSSYIRAGHGADNTKGYNGYKNITIKNVTFDDQKIPRGSSLVRFAHAQNFTLENVTMKNTFGVAHQLTFAASKNVKIKNCSFLNMDVSTKAKALNCEAIQIDVLMEKYFGNYPLYDGTPTQNVEITGCVFKNLSRGCGTHTSVAGSYFTNMKINNNSFENIDGYAIRATNYRNSEIKNNKITNCGNGIVVSDLTGSGLQNCYTPFKENTALVPDSNIVVSGNKISVCDTGYSRAYASGIEIFGEVVKNKKFADGKTFSGDFRMRKMRVENNTISSTVKNKAFHAININGAYSEKGGESSDFVVSGNVIKLDISKPSKQTSDAFRVKNSVNLKICSNSTDEKSKKISAFILLENCNGVSFLSNSFSTGGEYGVLARKSTRCVVEGNTFKKTASHAVYLYKNCKKMTVTSNKIQRSSDCGITLRDCAGATVSKNSVKNVKKIGVYVASSSGVSVTSNTLSGCATGIYSRDSSGKYISRNNVYSPTEEGIFINGKGSFKSVASNYILTPGQTAIDIAATSTVTSVEKNRIDLTSSSTDAIRVRGDASVQKITENEINRQKNKKSKKLKTACDRGIALLSKKSKTSEISQNKIKNCDEGIYVTELSKKPKIRKNEVTSCRYAIVYKNASLSKNKISLSKAADYRRL